MAIIFILILIFDHKNFKLEIKNLKLIVLAAFLVALAVFLNTIVKTFLNSVISAKIFEAKLGNFALVLIGFFCGGGIAFLSGIAADFLGLIILTSGTPVLFWTLTSIIWCVVPYYVITWLTKIFYTQWIIYCYLILTYAFTLLLISSITPIVLKYMYDLWQGWWLLYLPRIIKYPIDVIINGLLLVMVYRVFVNSVNLNTKIKNPKVKVEMKENYQSLENEGEIND